MKQNRDNGCFVITLKNNPFKIGFAILFFSFWKQIFFLSGPLGQQNSMFNSFCDRKKQHTNCIFFNVWKFEIVKALVKANIHYSIYQRNASGDKFNDLSQSYLFDLIELHAIKLL